ncbi:hypothetical protein B0O80DRAFT_63159 [Mortierella sp. GBAus27b]|nr:hypothetical protein B0O80DRAFT_63159 [Mortierella sp. GBAus27b]
MVGQDQRVSVCLSLAFSLSTCFLPGVDPGIEGQKQPSREVIQEMSLGLGQHVVPRRVAIAGLCLKLRRYRETMVLDPSSQ